MAPSKTSWDDEESSEGTPGSPQIVARRGKFDDEEEDDDVLESWDAAEDSEVEREKAKKAAEAKAKAEAEAKANHKSKSQRIEERREANRKKMLEEEDDETDSEEDEADRLARMRASEKEADLKNAEDLFADIGINPNRSAARAVTVQAGDDPASAVDLSKLALFNPKGAAEFTKLRETLVPLLAANSKKPNYALFMVEFAKQICKDLNSEQIKKVASGLTTMSNEKMKEEKAADKGGKKTKAAKSKVTLATGKEKNLQTDTMAYDDGGLDDGDFM